MSETSTDASGFVFSTVIDAAQVKKDLDWTNATISDAMQTQSGWYFHYAALAARARSQHERCKTALEILEATLDASYRHTLRDEHEAALLADPKSKMKPPTEQAIRSAVVNDPKWKAMSARVIEAQQIQRLADAAERAFDGRRDLLIQASRDAARQLEGGIVRVAVNQGAQASREGLLARMAANTDGVNIA